MPSVVMLNIFMLNVPNNPFMLSVIMLSVVAPNITALRFLIVLAPGCVYAKFLANFPQSLFGKGAYNERDYDYHVGFFCSYGINLKNNGKSAVRSLENTTS